MKTTGNDILSNEQLKKMPFSTPEGYLEGMKHNLKTHIGESDMKKHTQRWTAICTAAAIALLVTAGAFFLTDSTRGADFTEEDYLVFSDDISIEAIYTTHELYAQSENLSEDEIIQYLIDTDWEVDEVE